MNIQPDEASIVGTWILQEGKIVSDTACKRIESLVQSELVFVARGKSGWEVLYVDVNDGRYWEQTFPHSEMHGGGPPMLQVIELKDAAHKYELPDR
ncbi:Imm27 family immunity protein [Acidicapsa dinghuensis]|uniref:Imm27 family immunity protein n=1 Tax=Acidicapsa dinghuensis TaxID=2218256 RepID=A0ABW1EEH2_9BACT|nr:Imm27 family immunity protein [Acidicapsa dinghuensis]